MLFVFLLPLMLVNKDYHYYGEIATEFFLTSRRIMYENMAIFDQYLALFRKRHKIGSRLSWNA